MAEFAQIASAIAWPTSAIIMLVIIICSLDKIAKAFRKLPLIRRVTLKNVTIELSKENLDQLKGDTDKAFEELIRKTDSEIQRFARTVQLESYLSNFAQSFFKLLPKESRDKQHVYKPRMTAYIVDPIFEDQLYQVTGYCHPALGRFSLSDEKGPGRRFSIRYGIIGRAARMQRSEIIGDAFQGDTREKLISDWSMLPEQADAAAKKPSCIALVITDPDSKAFLGIVYADATEPHFFCTSKQNDKFKSDAESNPEFENLRRTFSELSKLTTQIEVKFDLVHIGQKK